MHKITFIFLILFITAISCIKGDDQHLLMGVICLSYIVDLNNLDKNDSNYNSTLIEATIACEMASGKVKRNSIFHTR